MRHRARRAGPVFAAVAAMALGGLLLLRAEPHPGRTHPGWPHAGEARRPGRSAPRCGTEPTPANYVGVAVNPPLAASVHSFSSSTRVTPSLIEYYTAFGRKFNPAAACAAVRLGAMPLVQINPRKVRTADIAAGHWDGYLRSYARQVRAFHARLVISFGHEMNGRWYPWGRPRTSPAVFIAAWRHIVRIFASEHVSNVIWSWDVTHGGSAARTWWPGWRYVDWIGIDGYFRPSHGFSEIFGRQLADIRSFTRKPVYLSETAVAPGPGRPEQIGQLFAAIRTLHLLGLVWFDVNTPKGRWRIQGDPASAAAFRGAVRRFAPGDVEHVAVPSCSSRVYVSSET